MTQKNRQTKKVTPSLQTPLELSYRMTDLELKEFEISDRTSKLKESLLSEKYEFRFDVETTLLTNEKNVFQIGLIVILQEKTDDVRVELARLNCTSKFELINFGQAIRKEDDHYMLPDLFVATAIGLTVSAARGMFVVSTKGTVLSGLIIPIINPLSLLPKASLK